MLQKGGHTHTQDWGLHAASMTHPPQILCTACRTFFFFLTPPCQSHRGDPAAKEKEPGGFLIATFCPPPPYLSPSSLTH